MRGSSVLGVPRLLVQMYISPTLSPSRRAGGVKIWANFIHSPTILSLMRIEHNESAPGRRVPPWPTRSLPCAT